MARKHVHQVVGANRIQQYTHKESQHRVFDMWVLHRISTFTALLADSKTDRKGKTKRNTTPERVTEQASQQTIVCTECLPDSNSQYLYPKTTVPWTGASNNARFQKFILSDSLKIEPNCSMDLGPEMLSLTVGAAVFAT